MKTRGLKIVGVMILIVVMVCVVTYAGKHKKTALPAAVKAAIEALYPQAVIEEAKTEKECLKVYEVELKQDGQEFEVTFAPDGTVIEVEMEVAMEDLPPAVAETVAKAARGANVKEIEQEATYAVVKLVMLETPQITYEAELTRDGMESEIELADDGTILEKTRWQMDDDDEDEEQVSIDQVPVVVKATILDQAQGGTIKEIERENEDGRMIYEAEVVIDGQEVEIKVAADGTLLSKKIEDDDEDDDEDD